MKKFLIVAGVVVLTGLIVGLLVAWPFMLLWNWLMPSIFDLRMIGFWEAFGLTVMAKLIIPVSSKQQG